MARGRARACWRRARRARAAADDPSAVSAPAAVQSGAAARQRAANAQSELRSAASRSGSGAAVEPRMSRVESTDSSHAGAHDRAVRRAQRARAAADDRLAVSAPAAAQSGAAARQRAAIAQSELRSAASGSDLRGDRAAHELRTRATTRGMRALTTVLCAEHNGRKQPPTRPVGGERARRRAVLRSRRASYERRRAGAGAARRPSRAEPRTITAPTFARRRAQAELIVSGFNMEHGGKVPACCDRKMR